MNKKKRKYNFYRFFFNSLHWFQFLLLLYLYLTTLSTVLPYSYGQSSYNSVLGQFTLKWFSKPKCMHTITFIFLCTRLDDTYESTQMHILIKTFTVCLCDNYNFHELDRWFSSWAYIWHIFQSMLRRDSVCMQSHRAFTALSHTQSVCLYGIFYQSMLKQALAYVQSHQSLH